MNYCRKCGHAWYPRFEKRSKQCPNLKCHSVNWETGKDKNKYKFNEINIGEEKLYPWPMTYDPSPKAHAECMRARGNIWNTLRAYEYRTKRRFHSYGTPQGLLITRMA